MVLDSGRQDTSLLCWQSLVGQDSAGGLGIFEVAQMYLAPYNDHILWIWLS